MIVVKKFHGYSVAHIRFPNLLNILIRPPKEIVFPLERGFVVCEMSCCKVIQLTTLGTCVLSVVSC